MKEIRVPSDTIKFIFAFLGEGTRFAVDKPKIESAIYTLSQDPTLSSLFRDFIFDTSRIYPHTETVNHALDRLQLAGLLVMVGWKEFEVSKALSQSDPSTLFSEAEIAQLKEAADKFYKIIWANNLKKVT
ncbi:MAG: hypothetical protein HY764_04445 [Candidatus Portnoybacteria bacterium]|nr:hypothetical protein [Candidatus Portnoybacteria bacterium]